MEISRFKTVFPEFNDAAVYPDGRVSFWLGLAEKLIDRERWGRYDLYEEGVLFLAAHNLAVERSSVAAGGAATGPVTSQSQTVDKLSWSESRDVSAYADAGILGSTVYGQQYLDLCRLIGAAEGVRQL